MLKYAPAALAILALTGCGTTTIVTTVQSSSPKPIAAKHEAAQHQLSIGDSATLKGEQSGEQLEATLLSFKESITAGEYDTPQSGMKYVGVTLKLTNIGTVPYSDSPSNGATILTASGAQGKIALISSGECSEGFATSVKIAPGESQEGCIPFELPQEDTAARLQWTPSSGFGEETAEWSLTQPSLRSSHPGQEGPAVNLTHCDPNISAGMDTSCPFAENVFKAYAEGSEAEKDAGTFSVKSPATGKMYSMTCTTTSSGSVNCEGQTGAFVTFPLHAAQIY